VLLPRDDAGVVLRALIDVSLNRGRRFDRGHVGQETRARHEATSLLDAGIAIVVDEDTSPVADRADDLLSAGILRVPGSVAIGTIHR
jgi:hypothetical protein